MATGTLVRNRWCVGIDLHKDTMYVVALDPRTGEVIEKRLACKCRRKIVEFFAALPRPHVVAIETVGTYRWLFDLLAPVVDELHLADATAARALAGRRSKTDAQDATNLAELLAAGRLPEAWVAPPHVAALRDWTRQRNHLSRTHARILHRVKTLMNLNNRPGPARLKADGLIRYLKAHGSLLPERHVEQLWLAVDQLALAERQIDQAQRRIEAMCRLPVFAEDAALLQSAPGVGPVVAATVLAEIGDFRRFLRREAIVRYAGLNPRLFQSGRTTRTGRIAKAGSPELRWALVQAAWVAVRTEPRVRGIWLRISRRAGRKKAIVAVAKRLLMWLWAMLRDRRPYRQVA